MSIRWRSLLQSIRATGLLTTVVYKLDRIRLAAGVPATGILKLQPTGLAHPLELRRGRSSDMEVYRAVFIQREYDSIEPASPPALILDLGANIGASAVYFLNRFPETRVVAIEPDHDNFLRCQANLAPYGARAIVINGGVWSHMCHLEVMSQPAGAGQEWAITVQEAAEPNKSTVRAWDVLSLLALAPGNAQQIDILKVDIEGSERQLFSATAQNWLPLVRNICIELHGPACEEVFWGAMAGYSYVKATSGELTLCSAIRRRTD